MDSESLFRPEAECNEDGARLRALVQPRLTAHDLTRFNECGFLVIQNVISPEHVNRLRRMIFQSCGADPNDETTWYVHKGGRNGSVGVYHHQSQWDARQCPAIYQSFADVLGHPALWVSIDRAKLQMPVRDALDARGTDNFIHWDIDLRVLPERRLVQGVLCLSHATANHGGFQCVPGFHRKVPHMSERERGNPWAAAARFSQGDIHVVEANAGDLIVWDSLLPHGAGYNYSQEPRAAQFIRMFPAAEDNLDLVETRIRHWSDQLPAQHCAVPVASEGPAQLTSLGRKLLGLDTW